MSRRSTSPVPTLEEALQAAKDACDREAFQPTTTGLERNHLLGLANSLRAQIHIQFSKHRKAS